ncbi:hypothetical protein BB559_001172 [Furculomyces boomerangus]|uniref:B box-type domain-containing protein n=1 Tax=Furculomyces boomerangus TaxID=61424 RepID=A0A2T9Z2Z1_9FUNG|nr:hypothetical protein BB559_001172 [Furculomyces boomerangus]
MNSRSKNTPSKSNNGTHSKKNMSIYISNLRTKKNHPQKTSLQTIKTPNQNTTTTKNSFNYTPENSTNLQEIDSSDQIQTKYGGDVCKSHNNIKMEYWCLECTKGLCEQCLKSQEHHKTHTITALAIEYDHIYDKVDGQIELVLQAVETHALQIEELKIHQKELEKQYQDATKLANHFVEQKISKIKTHFLDFSKRLSDTEKSLTDYCENLHNQIDSAQTKMENYSRIKAVSSGPQIIKKLSSLVNNQNFDIPSKFEPFNISSIVKPEPTTLDIFVERTNRLGRDQDHIRVEHTMEVCGFLFKFIVHRTRTHNGLATLVMDIELDSNISLEVMEIDCSVTVNKPILDNFNTDNTQHIEFDSKYHNLDKFWCYNTSKRVELWVLEDITCQILAENPALAVLNISVCIGPSTFESKASMQSVYIEHLKTKIQQLEIAPPSQLMSPSRKKYFTNTSSLSSVFNSDGHNLSPVKTSSLYKNKLRRKTEPLFFSSPVNKSNMEFKPKPDQTPNTFDDNFVEEYTLVNTEKASKNIEISNTGIFAGFSDSSHFKAGEKNERHLLGGNDYRVDAFKNIFINSSQDNQTGTNNKYLDTSSNTSGSEKDASEVTSDSDYGSWGRGASKSVPNKLQKKYNKILEQFDKLELLANTVANSESKIHENRKLFQNSEIKNSDQESSIFNSPTIAIKGNISENTFKFDFGSLITPPKTDTIETKEFSADNPNTFIGFSETSKAFPELFNSPELPKEYLDTNQTSESSENEKKDEKVKIFGSVAEREANPFIDGYKSKNKIESATAMVNLMKRFKDFQSFELLKPKHTLDSGVLKYGRSYRVSSIQFDQENVHSDMAEATSDMGIGGKKGKKVRFPTEKHLLETIKVFQPQLARQIEQEQ